MRLRFRYLIAGIAWALLLGPLACLAAVAGAAGVAWLWLFGDNPWPSATQRVLPLIGAAAGLAVAAGCIVFADRHGSRREALPLTARRGESRKLAVLTAAPLLVLVLLGLNAWRENREHANASIAAAQRKAVFTALANNRHRIAAITVERSADDTFRAEIDLSGRHEGDYRLRWQVADTGFDAILVTGSRILHLRPGEQRVTISFTLDQLAHRYRTRLLGGRGGVLVEEPFRLSVSLDPALREPERGRLPPEERRRLGTAQSPLHSAAARRFLVRFLLRRDGRIGR